MKLMIDISKDRYDEIMSMDWKNCRLIFGEELRAIHDGKVLEQEPCEVEATKLQQAYNKGFEDCRQAVLNCLTATKLKKFDFILQARAEIKQLPPVTPQPKMGQWIYGEDLSRGRDGWFCSKCGHFEFWDYSLDMEIARLNLPNICPNCGAKMENNH